MRLRLPWRSNTLRRLGWPHTIDNGWKDWDLEVRRGFMWRVRMTTVTEYHGDGKWEAEIHRVAYDFEPQAKKNEDSWHFEFFRFF